MYNFAIVLMASLIRLVAPFRRKVRLMTEGQQESFHLLKEKIARDARYIWVHAASLGEFEQARPLIETIKKEQPHYKILLTFFSPSGYEVQKAYPLADLVCYLPFDTKRNVRRFLDLANPVMALFIKYEFWYNYIHESYQRQIPVYLVSAIFRPGQIFFRKLPHRYGKMLRYYSHLFVQDEASATLLRDHHLNQVTVTGDTRIDRVIEIEKEAKALPLIERFSEGSDLMFIAGSSWPADEELIIDYFNSHPGMKLIIAPHEIDELHLTEIERRLQRPSLRYSEATDEQLQQHHCLIIDCFGLLSSIYRYGDIGYVGGGFGAGIHNLPEAAVHGIPVIFGPNYTKFREAHGLIREGGGFSINNRVAFEALADRLMHDPAARTASGLRARNYIRSNAGATRKIMNAISL